MPPPAVARVVHLVPDLAIGGGQTIILNHVRHCDRDAFDVAVWRLGDGDALDGAFAEAGSPPVALHAEGRSRVAIIRDLVRRLRAVDADLIHVHSDVDRQLGHVAAAIVGIPVVGHLHAEWIHFGPHPPTGAGPLKRIRASVMAAIRDRVERRVVAHYIAESNDVERIFTPLVDVSMTVLRQSIPLERFDGPPPAAIPGGPNLVSVARMVPGKGHERLIEAFAHVADANPTAVLRIVGDGELRPDVEAQLDRLGIADRVELLGDRHDVPDLLRAADLFVFASESEGFGLVILEAMAARLPVVAWRLPAFEEFVDEGSTGVLVDGDAAQFAHEVLEILASPDQGRAMGERGREVVETRFPSDAVARCFEAVYREVLDAR